MKTVSPFETFNESFRIALQVAVSKEEKTELFPLPPPFEWGAVGWRTFEVRWGTRRLGDSYADLIVVDLRLGENVPVRSGALSDKRGGIVHQH